LISNNHIVIKKIEKVKNIHSIFLYYNIFPRFVKLFPIENSEKAQPGEVLLECPAQTGERLLALAGPKTP